jgi:Ala-tRNA(Pro) deacylase
MPSQKLKDFLDANGVRYVSTTHSAAYTAQEIASIAHIKGKELAKTVMVKIDEEMAMAVLPASYQVDLPALRSAAEAGSAVLATEAEFRGKFPECDTGAMPPFGNLYGLPVVVEETLTRDKEIAFSAGTHRELIRLAYEDFARLVRPKIAKFRASTLVK